MNQKPSLLIIGNSNVGKSFITRLLMPNPKKFKGKVGKTPGSTLLIKSNTQNNLPYKIVDLPGFGYIKSSSRRRGEHVKKQIIVHIENHYEDYFFALIVINIMRIEDELQKYFIQNKKTIPLSFELIQFLNDFNLPLLILFNKIDKISNFHQKKIISFFIESAKEYGMNLTHIDESNLEKKSEIPYLEFSALKKINLQKLKRIIQTFLEQN